MKTLLWYNNAKRTLETAVSEASAAHLRRLGSKPTHVILPPGEWPAEVGGLRVETCKTVKGLYLKVYDGGEK
jgi:hypothetical protein